jgi:hypothetical protein
MAVTAKFQADFDSFYSAVQKAEVSLKSFEQGAGKVETSLTKMSNSLSGTKMIQDAVLMSEAVERLGGTSKLTADELQKVAAQAAAATAKLTALGQDIPPGLAKIAAEAKTTSSTLDNMKSIAGSIAGAFGIAFSVGAVVNFGKSVFDSASQIHDLAEQVGVSSEAVQGFKFAAEQAGSSIDAVGIAITKMNQHLAGGDTATIKALKDAGLAFADIRAMKPEDAFLAITDAIEKIPDPMTQSDVALKLFGKSAAELLPAIKEGFRGVSDAADKMSNDTIRDLEAAQDAWGALGNKVTIITGKMIVDSLNFLNVWKRMNDDIDRSTPKAPKSIPLATQSGLGLNLPDPEEIDRITKALGEQRDVLDEAAKKAKAHADAVQAIADKFSGAASIKDAQLALEAFNANTKAGVTLVEMDAKAIDALHATLLEAVTAFERFGKIAPKAMRDLLNETVHLPPAISGIGDAVASLGTKAAVSIPILYDLPVPIKITQEELDQLGRRTDVFKELPKLVKQSTDSLGDMSRAISELAQISGGSFSGIARNIGSIVGAANTAMQSIKTMKDAANSPNKLEAIVGMTTGIMGIVTAAVQAAKAVANLFDRNKGRDLVVDFADTFGGFDQLHEQLLTLGEAGEALWVKLTQGVGRNNPQQAQAAIDEVSAALDKQKKKQDEAGTATEEQAAATIETASQAQAALEELGGRLTTNEDEWAEWSRLVNLDIDSVARALRTLPLPSGSSGSFGTPAPAAASSSRPIQVSVQIDKREIARSVAEFATGVGVP